MTASARRKQAAKMDESILTDRQKQVLRLIRNAIRTRGVPPSRNELAKALKLKGGGSSVEVHLYGLQRKGFISLIPNVQRGIKLTQPEPIPVLEVDERLASGQALFEENRIVEYLPWSLVKGWEPEPDFCVRLTESAMREANLGRDDVIGVHAGHEARAKQRIIVRVDGEVRCCRLGERSEHTVELKSLGLDHKAEEVARINTAEREFRIEGIVVGMIVAMELEETDAPPDPAPK